MMPILNLTLSGMPDAARSARIATTLTQLTESLLHKDAALTSVVIAHQPPAHWFIGGTSLEALARASFFLDILVTDETNTASEKAAYIAAVFAAMSELLGPLHPVSYIHVHDARAAAWGYGGQTQQYRAIKKVLLATPA
jgi:4-oxalocrotonate tautomerase